MLALLAEPGPAQPAHDPATQYVPPPAKVQAALALAVKVQSQTAKVLTPDVLQMIRRVGPVASKAHPLLRREVIKRQALAKKAHAGEPIVRPVLTLAAPRERRAGRTSSPSRAGPSDDSDPGGSDPDEPSPSRQLKGPEDARRWLQERRRTLTSLTAKAQQLTLERWAA